MDDTTHSVLQFAYNIFVMENTIDRSVKPILSTVCPNESSEMDITTHGMMQIICYIQY